MIFIKHYLQVLLPLLGLYSLYAVLVVPRIEPKVQTQATRWEFTSAPSKREGQWWEGYFREDAWQRQNPLMIQRDKTLLLYQKREQLTDTRWRFSPLTIVVPQGDEGERSERFSLRIPEVRKSSSRVLLTGRRVILRRWSMVS